MLCTDNSVRVLDNTATLVATLVSDYEASSASKSGSLVREIERAKPERSDRYGSRLKLNEEPRSGKLETRIGKAAEKAVFG